MHWYQEDDIGLRLPSKRLFSAYVRCRFSPAFRQIFFGLPGVFPGRKSLTIWGRKQMLNIYSMNIRIIHGQVRKSRNKLRNKVINGTLQIGISEQAWEHENYISLMKRTSARFFLQLDNRNASVLLGNLCLQQRRICTHNICAYMFWWFLKKLVAIRGKQHTIWLPTDGRHTASTP